MSHHEQWYSPILGLETFFKTFFLFDIHACFFSKSIEAVPHTSDLDGILPAPNTPINHYTDVKHHYTDVKTEIVEQQILSVSDNGSTCVPTVEDDKLVVRALSTPDDDAPVLGEDIVPEKSQDVSLFEEDLMDRPTLTVIG